MVASSSANWVHNGRPVSAIDFLYNLFTTIVEQARQDVFGKSNWIRQTISGMI